MDELVILNVDDDDAKRYSVTRTLRRAGYTVTEARTGLAAIEAASNKPALIVLDIALPDMSGLEVCRRLKSDPETATIPVLHLSASFTTTSDKIRGLETGADGYLTQPVEPEELVATVRALIRLCEAEHAARASAEALRSAYRREKRIAEQLQRALLIDVHETAFPGHQVGTFYEAAWHDASIGGDFYDIFAPSSNTICFVIGDATGKGLAAAARTAEVKFSLRAFLHDYSDPSTAIERLNNLMCDSVAENDGDQLVALGLGAAAPEAGRITFTCAGCEPPIILRKDGTIEISPACGIPLGAFHDMKYQTFETAWEAGDTLLMVTDGITEARRGGQFISEEGLLQLVRTHLTGLETVRLEAGAIVEAVREYTGGKFQDDVCVVAARRID